MIQDITALVPAKKKTSAELMKELADEDGSPALLAVLDRMTKLERVNSSVKEVIMAGKDVVDHYLEPGPARFQRMVRLRKALVELEARAKKGKI